MVQIKLIVVQIKSMGRIQNNNPTKKNDSDWFQTDSNISTHRTTFLFAKGRCQIKDKVVAL